jgi:hypothetical protein
VGGSDAIGQGGGGGAAYGERAVLGQHDRTEPQLGPVVALGDVGQRADRCGAAALERGQRGALGEHGGVRRGVVERGQQVDERVVGAALDGERALTGRGQHLERVEHFAHLVQAPDPGQACACQHHRVTLSCSHLADPGVDVATDGHHDQTEAECVQLRGPARRAGADDAAGGELAEGEPVAGDDDVARVLALGNGRERDPGRGVGREVLEGVHREVDLTREQRVAQRVDEHTRRAALQRRAGGLAAVAVGGDLDQLGVDAEAVAQQRGDVLGLGGGEQAAAGADAQRAALGDGHEPPSSGTPIGRVTASTASGSSANSSARAAA